MLTEIEPNGGAWLRDEFERLEAEMAVVYPEALSGDVDAAMRVLTIIEVELELLGLAG